MSSSATPSLADRLVRACRSGDLPSAVAAVADGASVNEKAQTSGWIGAVPPLAPAVNRQRDDVVVWLLSNGADPNGYRVMWHGARFSTAGILQPLIDAGGDANRQSWTEPPLFCGVRGYNSEDRVRVLLALPSLDLTIKHDDRTPEQYAHYQNRPALVDMIAQEVGGEGPPEGLDDPLHDPLVLTVCVA